jgi:type VI secretion system secreted protein Hcp
LTSHQPKNSATIVSCKIALIAPVSCIASQRSPTISQNIFLFVKGEKSGTFFGEERDGTIECLYYEHTIVTPRDPSTGLSSANLRHMPVVIRKQVDSTSPLFAKAMNESEPLETVVARFVPLTHSAGAAPAIFFVQLSKATIASFKHYFADSPSARFVGWQLVEEVAFHYQKIEWGFNDKVSASSTWPLGN